MKVTSLVILFFLITLIAVKPARSYDIRDSGSIGIHYPGVGIRYNSTGKGSWEFRFARDQGITLFGGRYYRLLKEYRKTNLYIAPEIDIMVFNQEKYEIAGAGFTAGIFGCLEFFIGSRLSLGFDMGPGFCFAKNSQGGSATDFGLVVNISFNWFFKKSEK